MGAKLTCPVPPPPSKNLAAGKLSLSCFARSVDGQLQLDDQNIDFLLLLLPLIRRIPTFLRLN